MRSGRGLAEPPGELRRDAALAIARRVAPLVRNLDEPMSMPTLVSVTWS